MQRCLVNRKIRELLGLSCRELAERVETTKQTISNYELGKTKIRYLERVVEIELDLAINECKDETIKKYCEMLKNERIGS